MKKRLEDIPNFGTRTGEPMTHEAWAVIEKLDQAWMPEREMAVWKELCSYQINNHPDPKMRDMFERLGQLTKIRRNVAQASCVFAVSPNQK